MVMIIFLSGRIFIRLFLQDDSHIDIVERAFPTDASAHYYDDWNLECHKAV